MACLVDVLFRHWPTMRDKHLQYVVLWMVHITWLQQRQT